MTRAAACTVLLAILASGCATKAPVAAVDPAKVAVYESPSNAPARYEVIRRLWVDSWRTAFGSRTYANREEGLADLRARAGALGGNGLLNAGCYPLPGSAGKGSAVICNGTVIRTP